MWADIFKRWIDLAFWWLPRQETGAQAQTRQEPGAPAAGGADRESAAERVEPERVVEPERPEPAPAEPASTEPEERAEPDDLTVIKGIGAAMQRRLGALGIATFRDLAAADAEELTERLQATPVVVSKAQVKAWTEDAQTRL